MTVRFRIFAFAATAPLVVACTALLGDFDESDLPPDAGRAFDGTTDAPVVVVDGGSGLGDSALTLSDAGDAGDARADAEVRPVATYTLGFDGNDPDGGLRWVNFNLLTITDAAASSVPHSAVASGDLVRLALPLFASGVGTLRLSAKVRIPVPFDSSASIALLRLGEQSAGGVLIPVGTQISFVDSEGSAWSTLEDKPEANGHLPAARGSFENFRVELHYRGNGEMFARAYATDASLGDRNMVRNEAGSGETTANLYAGFGESAGVFFDDVVVELFDVNLP